MIKNFDEFLNESQIKWKTVKINGGTCESGEVNGKETLKSVLDTLQTTKNVTDDFILRLYFGESHVVYEGTISEFLTNAKNAVYLGKNVSCIELFDDSVTIEM